MPLRIPATVTGLEASIQAQAKKAGRNLKLNLGTSAKSIDGLAQPLGRITGKADQFTKSMEAANARVLAFGASVGVLNAVVQGFKELVTTTIQVEKQLTSINAILGTSTGELEKFKKTIFEVARNTEQSFDTVATAALELSRQGLKAEEVTKRLNDAMILSRISGQGAAEAVAGLTAAINSFEKGTVSSSEVVNKFSDAAKAAAVSERDLAEAIKRAGSVASLAGVSFDELVGIVSAVQQKTSRGGAVIGNSFKTIFTRIQSIDKLETMQNLGVQVEDASGQILGATQLIKNLAAVLKTLPEARQLQIAENLVGKFQVAPFVAILDDYNAAASTAIRLTEVSQNAATGAYERNKALNETLAASINQATVNLKELATTLGKIGVTENLKNILGFFNSLVGNIKELLEGEGIGSDFARGLIRGIGNILSGPGLAIFAAIIGKLTLDLARFGIGSLQTFFGLNKAAKEQAVLQGQIASTLLGNKGIQETILSIENSTLSVEQKRAAQTKFFTTALNEQLRVMTLMQSIAGRIAPGVVAGTRGAGRGAFGRGAAGFIPNFDAVSGYGSEQSDIRRGVGGAPPSARAVSIPNFNFGGGQRGTMVANTSEFIVPNFAGGGSAIFNQNMVGSMGLPAGAKKVGAAGGFIPNFQEEARGTTRVTRGLTLTQGIASFRAGGLSRPQLTAGFGKTAVDSRLGVVSVAGKPVVAGGQKGMLNISQGHRYGVAALFPSKKTSTTSATFVGETKNEGILGLRERGFTGMSLRGVQISDLQTMQRKKRRGMKESENRKKLGRLFAEPLLRYGGELIGETFSNDEARKIRGKIKSTGGRGREGSKLFSTAVEGGIFESAISLITKGAGAIPEFKSHDTEREPFDFEEGGRADTKFKRAFGFRDNLVRADAKRTSSNSAVQSLIFKALNDRAERAYIFSQATRQQKAGKGLKGKAAAGGYIPNFAGALEDAIARESGAGVPINQIRINQTPNLRNAGNPQGLAVTNIRDEPTGRVPNFSAGTPRSAVGGATDPPPKTGRDPLLMFIALQTAVNLLAGFVGDSARESETFSKLLSGVNIAMTAFIAAQAFNIKGAGLLSFAKGTAGVNLAKKGAGLAKTSAAGLGKGAGIGKNLKGGLLALSGGLGVLGGSVLAVVGPLAALAAGIFIVREAFDIFSGNAKEAARRQKEVEEAAKHASRELNELRVPEEFKKSRPEEAKLLGEQLQKGIGLPQAINLGDPRTTGVMDFLSLAVTSTFGGAFTGKDKKARESLGGAFSGVFQAGLREPAERALEIEGEFKAEQQRKLRKSLGFSGKISADFFDKRLDELKKLSKLDASGIAASLEKTITKPQRKQLGQFRAFEEEAFALGLSDKPLDEQLEGVLETKPELVKGLNKDIVKQIQAVFGKEFLDDVAVALTKDLGTRELAKDTQFREGIQRTRGDTAKTELQNELKLVALRTKRKTALDQELRTAERIGASTKGQLANIKARVALQKNTLETDNSLLKVIQNQVGQISALNVDVSKRNDLMNVFRGLTVDQLRDTDKRKQIILAINDLDEESRGIGSVILANIEQQLLGEQALGAEKRQQIIDANQLNIIEAQRLDIINSIHASRDRGIKAAAVARGSALSLREIQNEIGISRIEADPNLTDRERRAALIGPRGQADRNELERFEIDTVKKLSDQFSQLGKKTEILIPFMGGLIGELQPDRVKAVGGFKIALENVAKKLLKESGPGGAFSATNVAEPLRDMAGTVRESNSNFDDLTVKLKLLAVLLSDQVAPPLQDAATKLRAFIEQLPKDREEFKFQSLLAGPDQFVGQSRQFRQNVARERAGNDPRAQFRLTEKFALEDLRDQARTGVTLAQRTQAGRQIPLVQEQFRLQEELLALKEEEEPNLEKIRSIEQQILDIDRERLMVNQKIGNLFADTFIKSFEDIKNQLGKTLVQDAEKFKDTITSGIIDSIVLGQDLGDTLRAAAADFFGSRAKANLEAAFDRVLSIAGGATGPTPSGGGGGLFDLLGGGLGGLRDLLGFNSGGLVSGGSRQRDDVPTLLTGGEFVLRKSAVQRYGPEFLEALNRGGIQTMQRGGFFSPGTYGQGEITGKRDLLDFATQSFTGGQFDQVSGGDGFGSVSLEPQSARLTMFGRRNSPLFQREQDSKREAFGLFTRQVQLEEQLAEQRREQKKAFRNSLLLFVGSAVMGGIVEGFAESPVDPNKPSLGDPGAGGVRGLSERPPPGLVRRRGGSSVGSRLFSGPFGTPDQQADEFFRAEMGLLHGRFEGDTFWTDPDAFISERVNDALSHIPTHGLPTNLDGPSILRFLRANPNLPETQVRELLGAASRMGVRVPFGGPSVTSPTVPGRAAGGYISPTAGVDSVPSMLSGGEFVMNAATTQRMGRGNLAALNAGGGEGGGDEAIVARLDELIAVTDGSGETVINITVNPDGTETQDGNGDDQQQNLAIKIKDVVRQVIDEEQRLGGSLRRN